MFGKQFYPTPELIIRKMLEKVDFTNVTFALEPSAGKGDLAAGIKSHMRGKPGQTDCLEIDSDLRAVLRERGYTVIGNDFLNWNGKTRYDLIAANPPFADGDKHLLHMLDLMQKGGQIACLLNATTFTNAESPIRKDLMHRLSHYNADVEFIPNAFQDAERKANVDCALVYVNIPKVEEADLLKDLKKAYDIDDVENAECTDLADGDIIKALVSQYNLESELGLKLIDDYKTYSRYIPAPKEDYSRTGCLINLSVASREVKNNALTPQNQYIRELRYKYWATLFERKELQRLMTNDVRQSYMAKLNDLRAYDFTPENILQIQMDLTQNLFSSVDDAILKMFDNLTYQHSMEKNANIHYYNGWKTNKACKVNNKVIVPFYGLYDNRWGGSWDIWKAGDYMRELEKIMGYLDSGRTGGENYDDIIKEHFDRKIYAGEKISFRFFEVSFKKKGSAHIWFTDAQILKKFNLFGGRNKNWLPHDYGKKSYSEMTDEEQEIVKSFEGKESYVETFSNATFYLEQRPLMMIAAAGTHKFL